jgi:hypothetical protein
MQEQNTCRELTLHETGDIRRLGRPAFGWLDSVEEDLKKMIVTNLRRKSQDRDQWRSIVKEARVQHGLYRQ